MEGNIDDLGVGKGLDIVENFSSKIGHSYVLLIAEG